ncbi:MAG: ParA family protein [Acidobacteriota bacterium]|nr:ParA family protein [Acidobacteriota bacterium]
MTIITVTGYKGGIGKSTTAFHLASYFSDLGKTVLIDGDPNRTALKWAGRSGETLPFTVADERQAMKIIPGMDYVIIDTPARPNSDDLKELAKGCDLLILPTSPDVVSLEPMLETARDVGEAKFRALITIVPPHPSKEGELMRDDLAEGGIPVFRTMIRRTVGFAKAAMSGRPIRDIEDARVRAAWGDYQSLGDEIREMLK